MSEGLKSAALNFVATTYPRSSIEGFFNTIDYERALEFAESGIAMAHAGGRPA
jgi:hypothetical protein